MSDIVALSISSDIVVMAVVWDEVEGPTILSKAPTDGLADPINVALQIYLSSVAVFGQHGETKRIDFSLPLLSISPNHLVIVAFDSWPDPEVRGDVRPFYIGFIMDRDTHKTISDYLNSKIWTYMDSLKNNKSSFDAQQVYEELINKLNKETLSNDIFTATSAIEDQNYTQIQALRDLENSSELWSRYKDTAVISTVMKSINKLKNIDNLAAGNGYFLAGTIFFHNGDYEKALELYHNASDSFKSVDDFKNSAESLFNSAVAAYRLSKYDIAKKNLLISADFIEDTARKARMFLYLAQTQDKLQEFESSSHSFEIAVENAIKAEDTEFVGQILSVYASKLQERAQSSKDITDSYKNSLLELSATQRQRAADYFIEKEMNAEAGTSLVLASKTYQTLSHFEKAINALEIAADTFLKDSDSSSAGRALIDVLGLYQKLQNVNPADLIAISERTINVINQISESKVKIPLLLRVYREKAKALETSGSLPEARLCYEQALEEGKELESLGEILSLKVTFANFLFQIEDYRIAGDLFHEAYSSIKSQSQQSQSSQRDRLLKNTNISYRRATTAHLQASNIFLHQKNYESALEFYSMTLLLMKKVLSTSPRVDISNNKEWIQKAFKGLKQKKQVFPKTNQLMFDEQLSSVISELSSLL